jgi:hypothetical protein
MDVPGVAPAGPTDSASTASSTPVSQTPSPGQTPAASPVPPPGNAGAQAGSGIASAIAKLYNVGGGSSSGTQQTAAGLDVSYKVVPGLDLVVTVFTNPATGQEVAQFPPELLLGVAQFFDQVDGVTLDKKA